MIEKLSSIDNQMVRWLKFFNEIYDLKSKDSEVFKMNVEMITTLEQIKSMLSRAYNTADRQLRNPFGDKESVTSYLLTKIQIVTNEINAFISEEENAFEAYYSEDTSVNHVENPDIGEVEVFPLDDSDIQAPVTPKPDGFNPLIHNCASEISAAFSDCWVEVKALKSNSSGKMKSSVASCSPEYSISIQPDGYTPNDIQLKLRSLGYAPTVKSIKEYSSSAWVYFDVSYNGIAFELSSTVDSIEPPDIERYSEPATDDELPF